MLFDAAVILYVAYTECPSFEFIYKTRTSGEYREEKTIKIISKIKKKNNNNNNKNNKQNLKKKK